MLENHGNLYLNPSIFTQWVTNLRDSMSPSGEGVNSTGFQQDFSPTSYNNSDWSPFFWWILFPLVTSISLRILGLPTLFLACCNCIKAKKEESLESKLAKIQEDLKELAGKEALKKIQADLIFGKKALEKIQADLKELAGKEALEKIQPELKEQNRKWEDMVEQNKSLQQQLQQINNAVFILIGRDGKAASKPSE